MAIEVLPGVSIPEEEITLTFARASGPGGQHVNTSDTRVELRFDVRGSRALTDEQKALVHQRLGSRITKDGVLVLHAGEHRSQTRNRAAAVARLQGLLAGALRPRRRRRPTKPTLAARERRLADKRRQAERKAARRASDW